jgi:hypothetical protein
MFETKARGRVNTLRNRAVAQGVAGLGKIFSKQATRLDGEREKMSDADHTKFHDTIAIWGQPEDYVPIGIATFLCEVTGEFAQPSPGGNFTGTADAEASFTARGLGSPKTDQDSWNFSMHAGTLTPVYRVLEVSVWFLIGQSIDISSELDAKAREQGLKAKPGDLAAKLDLKTVLRPIIVQRVKNPVAVTMTNSGTKYYTSDEAGARDVSLRAVHLALRHK